MGGDRTRTRRRKGALGPALTALLPALLSGLLLACDASYPSTIWTDPTYDHAVFSGGFQLLGTHADAPCTACHASSNYEPLFQPSGSSDCQACHQEDYEEKHGSLGYPDLCTLCHTPTEWTDGSFDHEVSSGGFPLLEIHGDLGCNACHVPGTFEPRFEAAGPEDCVTCHLSDSPAFHAQRGFPDNCGSCHAPTSWTDGSFDHLASSGTFELLGIHLALPCTFCHKAGTLEPFFDPDDASDCVTCHLSLYYAVHEGNGYPRTCGDCHTPTSWGNGQFNHPAISGGFELVGVHEEMPCSACHDPGTMAPLFDPSGTQDCVACHQADYDGKHGGTQFPLTCTLCHTPTGWSGGTFDHAVASGGFELPGVHAEKPCTGCHDATTFAPLFDPSSNQDCLACHRTDYEGKHGGMGYPTDCTACHTPTLWQDGSFDHRVASGGFELLGIHADRPCTSCHDPDTFQPLFSPAGDTDCISCHQDKYDLQHVADGYPTTCLSCHIPTAWENVDFDHDADYFPIFTGRHARRWTSCATCHPDIDDFADFTCFACHPETSTNKKHEDEPSYTYVSRACVTCHPDGTAD